MKENVEKALQKIRPALQADGGDIELIDVVDGVVKVRLTGACGGCPMSQMTLKMGVEKVLKQQVPEVKSVETVKEYKGKSLQGGLPLRKFKWDQFNFLRPPFPFWKKDT